MVLQEFFKEQTMYWIIPKNREFQIVKIAQLFHLMIDLRNLLIFSTKIINKKLMTTATQLEKKIDLDQLC
ncbi:MAG: hypothetical protein M3Q33_02950, partial [Acidobacteriota bacterium]|nr:hypothetical protein [Acidobacteriota bacterium]